MTRYTYAYGYGTADDAEDALESLCANGEISPAENPRTESYRAPNGSRRWRITLEG